MRYDVLRGQQTPLAQQLAYQPTYDYSAPVFGMTADEYANEPLPSLDPAADKEKAFSDLASLFGSGGSVDEISTTPEAKSSLENFQAMMNQSQPQQQQQSPLSNLSSMNQMYDLFGGGGGGMSQGALGAESVGSAGSLGGGSSFAGGNGSVALGAESVGSAGPISGGGGAGAGGGGFSMSGGGGMGGAGMGLLYAKLIAMGKRHEQSRFKEHGTDDAQGNLTMGMMGPSISQLAADPKNGAIGLGMGPFGGFFGFSDKNKETEPEWFGIGSQFGF